ncbi:hypothetical protein PRCB_10980 [Pantoea rodasii]|uniref:Uncharacterized protein n=1 Tax=Pantoea rodasii TaxID=1076549 RepID=A0A2M9WDL6_9GAMM|nr:hypothetical protein PRCB_10980 [Pantoea rodasii]
MCFPAKNPSSALISGRGFFYPQLPAIVKHGLSANDPEITRNTFLTYVRKNYSEKINKVFMPAFCGNK